MRYRVVTLIAFVITVSIIAATSPHLRFRFSSPVVRQKLPAKMSSYLGVFETGVPPGFSPVTEFGQLANRPPNLVGYYSGWAAPFDTAFAATAHRHGAVPYVQIDPTYASIPGIASGVYDDYLRGYADSVRGYGHPVVIGFGHEMNGSWYQWGYHHVRPATFVRAWQHVVTVFRAEGAQNVTWLWTVDQDRHGTGPISAWWPGASYVTWVGIDGYYVRPSDTFRNVFGRTIDEVRALTAKPVLLSETAVGPEAGQFIKIGDLFAGMRQYKTLGLVWFDIAQQGSLYHQDWRLEGNQIADAAFKLGVSRMG